MRENVWTKISAIAGVVAVIFAVCFFWQGRIDQSKKLESNPLTPPNFTPDHSTMFAVASIHATLLSIFL